MTDTDDRRSDRPPSVGGSAAGEAASPAPEGGRGGKPRALALLSGGLDSVLAVKLLLEQDVPVTALHFVSVFSPGRGPDGTLLARSAADELGVELLVRDATGAMLEFVQNPRFGRGKNMNPCIDCRVQQLAAAKSMLEETGAAYLATGEVLGQRPMSQRRDSMARVEREAGVEGLVVRPLTARNLDVSTPERRGWVDRERLLDISGRSRAEQMKLARMWGLRAHGSPAGGCLLTDRQFSWKLQDLLNREFVDGRALTANDVHLLKLGRHFRLGPATRAIVGRDEGENARVLTFRRPGDWVLVAAEGSSPETLLRGEAGPEERRTAAALTARYSKHRALPEVEVVARRVESAGGEGPGASEGPSASEGDGGETGAPARRGELVMSAEERLRVRPASEEEIEKLAVRRPRKRERGARSEPPPTGGAGAPGGAAAGGAASGDEAAGGVAAAIAAHPSMKSRSPGASSPASPPVVSPRPGLPRRRNIQEERPGEVEKTFMEHLMELRARIILCLVFLVLSVAAAWVFYGDLARMLFRPIDDYNERIRLKYRLELEEKYGAEVEKGKLDDEAKAKLLAELEENCNAEIAKRRIESFTERPTEAFVLVLRLGLWGGLILAFPVIAWQTWRFVSPGLYRREKLAILPIFTVGLFFFAGGCYFAYHLIIPFSLDYLYSFAPEFGAKPMVTLDYYFRFFLMIHLAFGIVFETPLVILALARLGLVTPRWLLRKWQYVTVGAFVVGAVLTPPDPVTQVLMGGSLIVLYVLSIFLALIFGRRKPWFEETADAEGAGAEQG